MITMLTYIAQTNIGEYKKKHFKCLETTLFNLLWLIFVPYK